MISSIVHSPSSGSINEDLDREIPDLDTKSDNKLYYDYNDIASETDLITKPEEELYYNDIASENKLYNTIAKTEPLGSANNPFIMDEDLSDTSMPNMAEIDEEVCFPLISNSAKDANNKSLDNIGFLNPIGQKVNFIIDSAATISTISNLNYFSSYKPTSTIVRWGKASTITATYKGEIYIKTDLGYIYLLRDIYYIPNLGINLISINQLTDLIALFMKNKVYLYTPLRKIVAIGKKEESLYHIKAKILYIENSENICYNTINSTTTNSKNSYFPRKAINLKNIVNTIRLWHIRLGHISIQPLRLILANTLGTKLPIESIRAFLSQKCRVCLLSKDNRYIYKRSINPTQFEILERIHSDLGGPLPPTYNNYRYYITFLDKKSRYLAINLLNSKSDAYKAFENFKAIAENAKGKRIKEFFTDNGTEYINNQFEMALTKYGISHKLTPTYTKEPNGLIERINLTLFNKVRSMLIQSNSPNYLWGEALNAATYLYNRTPHKSLGYKTPYEVYYGIKPNISNIRTWGSQAYYHTNTYRTKLSPRKEEAIIVGYNEYNHYKLWDYNRRQCLWSRDVTISENSFRPGQPKPNPLEPINFSGSNTENSTITDPIELESQNRDDDLIRHQNNKVITRGEASRIASDPNHKIEVQIPKTLLYNIDDTILYNYIGSINKTNNNNRFILTTSLLTEPNSYHEAVNSPEKDQWQKACISEVEELEKQETYDIIDTPPNITPIKGRWVFKKKPIIDPKKGYITNSDQTIRYKARWVIQGFHQKLGVDFLETFSTTCRTETWHLLLIIAINKGWRVIQYDVKNAFVHAKIDADIYTILPIGVYSNNASKCCHLKKALYGLKQSPRLWYQYLSKILAKFDFRVFPYDEGIYINSNSKCILICHVDDILVLHENLSYIYNIIAKISNYIKIEEIGIVSMFLGNNITIDYPTKTLYIDQKAYTEKLLSKFSIYGNPSYKPTKIPGKPGLKLRKNTTSASPSDINQYQKQIGSLLYLALKTRPELPLATIYCARYMSNPSKDHFIALNRIWKYLLATPNIGVIYNCLGNDLFLKGYSDADWGNDLDQRRSTSGYIFSLSPNIGLNNPISWNSQLQKTVALSSCEAEYMALKDATKEAIYLANVFHYLNTRLELGYTPSIPKLLVDNTSAKKLAENPEFHKLTKHIGIIYHFTRLAILEGRVTVTQIPSKYMLADFLTNVTAVLHKAFIALGNLGYNGQKSIEK